MDGRAALMLARALHLDPDIIGRVEDRGDDHAILVWSERMSSRWNAIAAIVVRYWSRNALSILRIDRTELPPGLRDLKEIVFPKGRIGRAPSEHSIQGSIDELLLGRPSLRESGIAHLKVPAANHLKLQGLRIGSPIPFVAAFIGLGFAGIVVWFGAQLTEFTESESPPSSEEVPVPPQTDLGAEPTYLLYAAAAVALLLAGFLVWALLRRRGRIVRPNPAGLTTFEATVSPVVVQNDGEDPHRVFVSYSRKDAGKVDPIVTEIERSGNPAWIDRKMTANAQQRYAAHIMSALRTTDYVALMCSRNAYESDHVVREVYAAGDLKKPFVLFMLDDADLPDEWRYFVSGFPRVEGQPATDMRSLFR